MTPGWSVAVRLIPRRVVRDKTGVYVELGLSMMPRPRAIACKPGGSGRCDLADWPALIASLIAQGATLRSSSVEKGENEVRVSIKNTMASDAAAIWQEAFAAEQGVNLFEALHEALAADQGVTAAGPPATIAKVKAPARAYNTGYVLAHPAMINQAFLEFYRSLPALQAVARLRAAGDGGTREMTGFSGELLDLFRDQYLVLFDHETPATVGKGTAKGASGRTTAKSAAARSTAAVRDNSDLRLSAAGAEMLTRRHQEQTRRHMPIASYFGGLYADTSIKQAMPAITPPPDHEVRDHLIEHLIRADFREHIGAPAAATTGSLNVAATVRESVADFVMATRSDRIDEQRFQDEENDPHNIARRKFLGLAGRPQLARAVGLLFELRVPLASLPISDKTTRFKLAVTLADGETLWTACEYDAGYDHIGPASIFAGSPNADPLGTRPSYIAGLLDLDAQTRSVEPSGGSPAVPSRPRYRLVQFDAGLGIEAWEAAARNRRNQILQGATPGTVSEKLPELRSGGLGLVDTLAAEDTLREMKAADRPRDVLYAEDLVAGYRIDVGLGRIGGTFPQDRWSSLVDRMVNFDALRRRVRDDGFVRPLARLTRAEGGKADVVVNPVMCVWSGDNLAVPSRGKDLPDVDLPDSPMPSSDPTQQIIWVDRFKDLGLPHTVRAAELGAGGDRGMAPLRFGYSYRLGARLAYIDGSSIDIDRASGIYERDRFTVGGARVGASDEPFVYYRWEEVQAPVLLLDPDDPLARATSPRGLAGAQFNRMVVRRGGATPRRYLAAPKVSFELAERHGMFEEADGQAPPGAFNRFARDRDGDFVALRGFGKPEIDPEIGKTKKAAGRGQVLRAGGAKSKPYYPDPLAERCCLAFLRGGHTPAGFGTGEDLDPRPLVIEFNRRQAWPGGAIPISIEVRRLPGVGEVRGRMRLTGSRRAPRVVIELAEGETIDLILWSAPTAIHATREHALIASGARIHKLVAAVLNRSGTRLTPDGGKLVDAANTFLQWHNAAAQLQESDRHTLATGGQPAVANARARVEREFDAIGARAPIPGLSTSTRLTLVHACQRPVLAPQWVMDHCRQPVALSLIRPALPGKSPEQAWAAKLAGKNAGCDRLHLHSDRGGKMAFLAGEALVEHASSGVLRVDLRWTEFASSMLAQRLPSGRWSYRPADQGWRSIPTSVVVPAGPGGVLTALDLTINEAGTIRALAFDFGDTRARRISARLVATSRYAAEYADLISSNTKNKAPCDAASPIDAVNYWLPATERPPAPTIVEADILPTFRFTTRSFPQGFEVEREAVCRVVMADWFASGEGEMLAVACWPRYALTERERTLRTPVRAIDAQPFAGFVTRRGHDPAFGSGRINAWLVKEDFPGALLTNTTAKMPYIVPPSPTGENDPAADVAREAREEVALAAFAPQFNSRDGRWFCDIAVDPDEAYAPFVRLSLVRWQPHAIVGEELSLPVTTWYRVLPRRTASVVFVSERQVRLRLRGKGFTRLAAVAIPLPQRPQLRITLQWYEAGWHTAALLATGNEYVITREAGDLEGDAAWDVLLDLPYARSDVHYAVYLEEFALLEGDDGDTGAKPVEMEQIYQCQIDLRTGEARRGPARPSPRRSGTKTSGVHD